MADRSGSLLTGTESLPGLIRRIGVLAQAPFESYQASVSSARVPKLSFWYFSVTEKYAPFPAVLPLNISRCQQNCPVFPMRARPSNALLVLFRHGKVHFVPPSSPVI